VLILGLGIGLATAVFSVAHTLLIRQLPVQAQDRLVTLWTEARGQVFDWPVSLTAARAFAAEAPTLESVAWYGYEGAWPTPVRDGDRLTPMSLALVSGRFFDVLGTRPALGRALRAEDDVVGGGLVAVLSHAAWIRHFSGRAEVIGRTLQLHVNGTSYTVVGVMPRGLDFPRGTDLWVPIGPATAARGDSGSASVNLLGRLRPGLPPTGAADDLTRFLQRPGATSWERSLRGVATSLPRLVIGEVRPAVIAFAAAAGLLLFITCINVANLLIVRGMARAREVAVRAALGATRGQVLRQLLAENAIIAIGGGAVGVGLAGLAIRAFIALAPPGLPRLSEVGIDGVALVGAMLITAGTLLVAGLAPAIITSRATLDQVLRSAARQSASRGSRLTIEGLVVGQVALAVLVLAAAGLVARSLLALEQAELAFDGSRLLITEMTIRVDRFDQREKQLALLDRVVAEVRTVPGVRAVSPVVAAPFSGSGGWDGQPRAEGQPSDGDATRNPMLNMELVTADYFPTFGLPIVRGRTFTEADREGAPAVVILSEAAARHYWRTDDPIGKRLVMAKDTFTVVGIVPETRYRELTTARPSIYFPLRQSIFPFAPTNLAIRANGPPADLADAIRRTIDVIDPAVAVVRSAPFTSYRDRPLAQPRLNALLLGLFASSALILAAVGLLAVMATMVRRRTRELGVRMALGATPGEIRSLVLTRGLTIAVVGLALGLGGGLLANRLLMAMLYQVRPTDPMTLVLVAGLILGVAAIATFIPARASTRIDPILALRSEG
jgi:putative ABC transport system permease protein